MMSVEMPSNVADVVNTYQVLEGMGLPGFVGCVSLD